MTGRSYRPGPVILTRTGGAVNQRLALRLSKVGLASFCWPAFKVRLPADESVAAKRFADLSDISLVLLVSPTAVAAVAHWVDRWPSHISLASVGEGTARVARAAWGPDVPIIYPQGDAAHSGSEALMTELRRRGVPTRVLICRGQTGREWLSQELFKEGVDVQKLECYERMPLQLSSSDMDALRDAMAGPPPVVYLTSSEAFLTVRRAVRPVEGAWDWLISGAAVVIHPRSEEKAREIGFPIIRLTSPDDDDVVAAVTSCSRELGAS